MLDFLKSEEGNKQPLPKLIDFSAQVRRAQTFPTSPFHLLGHGAGCWHPGVCKAELEPSRSPRELFSRCLGGRLRAAHPQLGWEGLAACRAPRGQAHGLGNVGKGLARVTVPREAARCVLLAWEQVCRKGEVVASSPLTR